jgi:hypothetical protein
LTTLLDLVDEDYKKTKVKEEEETQAHDEETQAQDDEEMNDASSTATSHQMDDAAASPVKKQRLDQDHPAETPLPEADIPSLPSSQSFIDLQFADIENLLHGDDAAAAVSTSNRTSSSAAEKEEGPKCKLVGGRMNTSGVALTKWGDEDNNVAASSDSVKAMAEDENCLAKEEDAPFSPVNDNFTTQVRVCLTCDFCKYRRSHTETYLHLSIDW